MEGETSFRKEQGHLWARRGLSVKGDIHKRKNQEAENEFLGLCTKTLAIFNDSDF